MPRYRMTHKLPPRYPQPRAIGAVTIEASSRDIALAAWHNWAIDRPGHTLIGITTIEEHDGDEDEDTEDE